MTTQELRQYIDKVLGNSIRCLLPSYWWKRLFNQVADRIDGAEQFASELIGTKVSEVKMPIVESEDALKRLDVEYGNLAAILRQETKERSFSELYQASILEIVNEKFANCTEIDDIIIKNPTDFPNVGTRVLLVFIEDNVTRGFNILIALSGSVYAMVVETHDGIELPLYVNGVYHQEGHDYIREELSSFQYKYVTAVDELSGTIGNLVDYDIIDPFITCVATLPAADVYVKGNTWERLAKQGESGGGSGGVQAITIYPLDRSTKQSYHRQVYDTLVELAAKGEDFIVYAEVGKIIYPATMIYANPLSDTPSYVFDFRGWAQIESHQGTITENEHYVVALFADGTMQLNTAQDYVIDHVISETSTNAVQNKVVASALNAKADKSQIPTKISQLEADDSYAIVIASVGFNMSRFDKNGRSLGDTWIAPNVPTRVYATSFKPNSTGRVKSIKLRHLNTQGAKSMREMFGRQEVWQDVTELDLSYFDTSSVIDMSNFAHLPNVTKLDVSSFDTSNVVDMSNMFRYCKKLTDIDLSCFNTSKVANFSNIFGECRSLKSLDLSNFDTTSATDMSYMFSSCQNLEYLNLSSFDTSNIKTLYGTMYMFSGCGNIKTLILGENFFKVAEPLESEGSQHLNRVDFSSLAKWTDESVVTSLVTNSYDRIANGLPEINILLSNATMAILTDEHKAVMATKGYVLI